MPSGPGKGLINIGIDFLTVLLPVSADDLRLAFIGHRDGEVDQRIHVLQHLAADREVILGRTVIVCLL